VRTPRQLLIFLQVAGDHRLFALYHLAAYTGARRGELLNLRWEHIDLDRAEVRIVGSAAVIGGQRIEGTTKSGRSRTVRIGGVKGRFACTLITHFHLCSLPWPCRDLMTARVMEVGRIWTRDSGGAKGRDWCDDAG
jgi:hypothetical protein